MRCPICGKLFEPDQSTAKPFCSERCKLIDLGRWLGEGYSVPADVQDEEPETLGWDAESEA